MSRYRWWYCNLDWCHTSASARESMTWLPVQIKLTAVIDSAMRLRFEMGGWIVLNKIKQHYHKGIMDIFISLHVWRRNSKKLFCHWFHWKIKRKHFNFTSPPLSNWHRLDYGLCFLNFLITSSSQHNEILHLPDWISSNPSFTFTQKLVWKLKYRIWICEDCRVNWTPLTCSLPVTSKWVEVIVNVIKQ